MENCELYSFNKILVLLTTQSINRHLVQHLETDQQSLTAITLLHSQPAELLLKGKLLSILCT